MLTVYSASAGSGKTYNLVLDYLATCFQEHLPAFLKLHDRRNYSCASCMGFRQILAITFTNNASAEMKDRVVRQLYTFAFAQQMADLDQNDFDKLCEKVFKKDDRPSPEECFIFLNRTSKALLYNILYDYAQFSITTIDSFIQRVIRSSALYLNLSMNYAVQIHLTDFFRMAIEQYICELSQNEQQFRIIVEELEQQLEDKGNANINRFLSQGLAIIYHNAEKSHPHVKNFPDATELSDIVKQWRQNRYFYLEKCKKEVELPSKNALAVFEEAEKEDIMPNRTLNWDKWFKHVSENPFDLEKGFDKSKCLQEMDENKVFTISQKLNKAEKEFKNEQKTAYGNRVKAYFEQIQDIVLKNAKNFFTYCVLAKNANRLLVLNALRNHIETIKEQTDSFFLSESNPLLNDKIKSGDDALLFEKISFYRHFFIDEFQDTSLMQWEDLKPLIINALSVNGNITLFGDVKQSIYRFRNGDAELFYRLSDFERLQNTPAERDISTFLQNGLNFHHEPLKTNFRSYSLVIEFNNHFFQHYANLLSKEKYYQDVIQLENPKKTGGLVQLYGYNKQDYKDIRAVWPECTEDFLQNIYLKLKPEEAELLYAVKDAKRRGYAYGDMAVLLSGRDKCNTFAQKLLLADVPVITTESLQLCDNASINVIINTLRFIINPKDTLAQTTILHYLCSRSGLDFRDILLKNMEKDFWAVADGISTRPPFRQQVEKWKTNPLFITIKEIIRFYQFEESESPFLTDFLDLVFDYEKSQIASVSAFLTWWDDLNSQGETIPRLSYSGDSDAVRLMTIHASKGLEFPVVITHCASSSSHNAYYWVKDNSSQQDCYILHEKNVQYSDFKANFDMEEAKRELDILNLWYVDFTRAREMLYILTDFSESKSSTDNKTNIRKVLKTFAGDKIIDIRQQDNIYYFGDFGWRKGTSAGKKKETHTGLYAHHSDLTFCDNDSIKVSLTEEDTESQATGTRIHNFLQKLTLFPSSEEEYSRLTVGEPEEIRTRLHHLFERTAQDSALRPYFYPDKDDKVLNETTIITEEGVELRPDRIVIKPDHVMIIDYKTGQEHRLKYEAQLKEYQECMQEMGYSDVRTEILYVGY